jgi:hypothetical protein
MTALAYGNGIYPVQAGAKTLREIDLLPNLAYMEMLLKVFDCAASEISPMESRCKDPDRLTDLLMDLCLARFHRDAVGKAADELGILPGGTYQGDVYHGLRSTFTELFPSVDDDEAKRAAHAITYGYAPVS